MNPLLQKHLYSSARRNRFFWLLGLYLLGIGLLTMFFLMVISVPFLMERTTISMMDLFIQGRTLFWFSSVTLMLTSFLLVPIGALGAIAGERENRTLDLLRTTTLHPRAIVLGKLGSAFLTGMLYVLAPLPLLMGGYWIGGVTSIELGLTMLMLLLTMLLSIAWALVISTFVRKTIAAVILYYVFNIILVPMVVILGVFLVDTMSYRLSLPLAWSDILWLNVLWEYGWVLLVGLHPLAAGITTEILGLEQGTWTWLTFEVSLKVKPTMTSVVRTATLPSPWIVFVIFSLSLSVLLLWIASRRLSKPEC